MTKTVIIQEIPYDITDEDYETLLRGGEITGTVDITLKKEICEKKK